MEAKDTSFRNVVVEDRPKTEAHSIFENPRVFISTQAVDENDTIATLANEQRQHQVKRQ
jgi:hypothetical protein